MLINGGYHFRLILFHLFSFFIIILLISLVWYLLLFLLMNFKNIRFRLLKSWRRQLPPTPPCNLEPCWPCISIKVYMQFKSRVFGCIHEMGSKEKVRLITKCKLYCKSDWISTHYKIPLIWVTCVYIKFIHTTARASYSSSVMST